MKKIIHKFNRFLEEKSKLNFRLIAPSITLVFIFMTGCASRFNRELAINRLSDMNPSISKINEDFKTPVRLAIYFDMETIKSDGTFIKKWDWKESDERLMVSFLNQFVKKRIASDYFFIPRNKFDKNKPEEIFEQAKKDHAGALLIVRGISFVDWYFNPAGIFDLTIIGSFWVPGSTREALVLLRADFWDLKGNELEFSLWAEANIAVQGPTMIINSNQAFEPAKQTALKNIIKELNKASHPCFDLKWN